MVIKQNIYFVISFAPFNASCASCVNEQLIRVDEPKLCKSNASKYFLYSAMQKFEIISCDVERNKADKFESTVFTAKTYKRSKL